MSLYRLLVAGAVAAGIAGCANSQKSGLENSSAVDAGRDFRAEDEATLAALKEEGYTTCFNQTYGPTK